MKRLIIAILLSTFAHGAAFSAVSHSYCNSKTTQTDCNGTAGCYWTYTNVDNQSTSPYNHCVACPAGRYNDGTIGGTASSCTSCGTIGTGVKWNSTQLGLTTQSECAFTANCTAAQFFSNYQTGCTACTYQNNTNSTPPIMLYSTLTQGYSVDGTTVQVLQDYIESKVCKSCGKNSTANNNGLGCTCYNWYHVSGQSNSTTNNDSTDCEPNKYTITYKSNNGENKTKTQNATYNSTITLHGKNTFAKTGHEISGWKYNNKIYSPSSQITYGFTSDITLTAQWSELPFTVTYDTGNSASCSLSDQSCTYGQSNCRALSADNCTYPGYVFKGWKCTSGCTDSNTIININSDISTISEGTDMTLTAQWEQCPAGYYCTDVLTQQSCPAGSTSDAGSYTKDKCHMTGGTTRICDTNENCFTLPASVGNIFYQGKNQ